MKNFKLKFYSIGLFILLTFNANAQQDSTERKQRFNISLGAFFPTVSTKVRIDSETTGIGTDIGLEETLGLSQNPSVFRIDGLYQMTKHSSFKATYFQMNRKKTWLIDRDIKIADTIFNVGATLDYYFNTQYFGLNYRYSAIAKKDFQFGLTFGLRWLYFKTGFNLVSDSINKKIDTGIGVPVVLFGLNASGNILPRLVGRYDFEMFKLSIQGIEGLVYENRLSLEYYFIKNIGAGVAFNSVLYSVKELPLSKNFDGEIKYSLYGLSVFAAFRF